MERLIRTREDDNNERHSFAVISTVTSTVSFTILAVVAFTITVSLSTVSATDAVRPRQPRFDDGARRTSASGYPPVAELSSKPIFRSTLRNVSVGPGDRAVLKCRVDNLGTKTVTWRRGDEVHPLTIGLFPFVADSRIAVDYNQRTSEWSLIIQDVRPTDEGVYHCQISTKSADNDNSYDVLLNVKGVHVTGTEFVERGNAIQLVCNASGRPEPPYNVEWYKDGEKINSDAETGVIITKKVEARSLVSMLVMKSSRMADAGVYVCRSSNRDAGMINVIVLNVAATVEKRGTSDEKIRSYDIAVAMSVNAGSSRVVERHLANILSRLVFTVVVFAWSIMVLGRCNN